MYQYIKCINNTILWTNKVASIGLHHWLKHKCINVLMYKMYQCINGSIIQFSGQLKRRTIALHHLLKHKEKTIAARSDSSLCGRATGKGFLIDVPFYIYYYISTRVPEIFEASWQKCDWAFKSMNQTMPSCGHQKPFRSVQIAKQNEHQIYRYLGMKVSKSISKPDGKIWLLIQEKINIWSIWRPPGTKPPCEGHQKPRRNKSGTARHAAFLACKF